MPTLLLLIEVGLVPIPWRCTWGRQVSNERRDEVCNIVLFD
jgi:hypothetical protein